MFPFRLFSVMAPVLLGAALAAAEKPKPQAKPLDHAGQLAANLEPTRVVAYKKVDGRELHLNVFEPKGLKPGDRRACFLTIHGGGWTGLTPRRQYSFADHFAKLGMVGISVEYRLAKPGSGPSVFDCVRDARFAARYVRAHAAELGIDPQRIVVNGGSAGGHLAAATALFDGVDQPGEDTSVSCTPNALVLFFPVIDTSTDGYGNKKIGPEWRRISPVDCVRPGVPPTILFHGTGDTVTPFKGAQLFHDRMLKAGNRCELVVTEGAVHGYLMRDEKLYQEAVAKTEAFLRALGFLP